MKKRLLLILCACVILDWYIKSTTTSQKATDSKSATTQESPTEKS